MNSAVIKGIGAYVPEQELSNAYFNELLGEDVDTWLKENVNIHNRRWCGPDESVADLCEKAAQEALQHAGVAAQAIDLIVVATDTPEYVSPSTATVLQHRLKATKAGTFDLNAACAGFITAMDVAAKYIKADDHYQNILVVGGYAMSKYLNKADKKTVTLFADGAGAIVMQASTQAGQGFLTSKLETAGQYYDWMGIYGGASKQPTTPEVLQAHDHQLKFVHRFPKELNPATWTQMTHELCQRMGITPQQVDHYFITQLNYNAIYQTMDNLEVPRQKAPLIMRHNGYTGSACIPMALHHAHQQGQLKRGQTLMFLGSGGGLAFAAAAVKY